MNSTLAFDVYGTLIDTQGVVVMLREIIGDKAELFSRTWRDKQLEYAFRRGLMRKYATFATCTEDALAFAAAFHKVSLTKSQRDILLDAYRSLPVFEDVKDGLSGLKEAGHDLYAFSNGTEASVKELLISAEISEYFTGIISVDEVRSFKPDPDVYEHLLLKTGSTIDDTWLISSNPFDVIGAISVGMRSTWLQRSKESIFDPWGIEPTVTIETFRDLKRVIEMDKDIKV